MRLFTLSMGILGLLALTDEAKAQYTVDATFDLLSTVGFVEATGAACDPVTDSVWICGATIWPDPVVEIDPQTGAVISALPFSFDPSALALDPTSGNLFLFSSGGIQVTQGGTVVNTLPSVPMVTAAACDATGELYVVPRGALYTDPIRVQRLDKGTGAVLATVTFPTLPVLEGNNPYSGMSFDPITGHLFVIQRWTGVMYELDLQAGTVVNTKSMYLLYGGFDWQVAMGFNGSGDELWILSGYFGAALQLTRVHRSYGAPTPYCFGDGIAGFCPCGNESINFRGCANSTSLGASLSGSGDAVIGQDTLVLHTHGAPAGAFGLFLSGANPLTNSILGDGLRCVGGSVVRIEVAQTGNLGAADSTRVISLLDGATIGSWRYYQFWYRDPQGPCGTGSNTSNAVSVQWQ